jgi:hypothetical protein
MVKAHLLAMVLALFLRLVVAHQVTQSLALVKTNRLLVGLVVVARMLVDRQLLIRAVQQFLVELLDLRVVELAQGIQL